MADDVSFPCYYVQKDASGVRAEPTRRTLADLPPGDVLVRVAYSSLNYKDGLSATGNPGVTRKFPHVPGIDCAGTVEASRAADLRPGEAVVITGHDQGQNTWGGLAGFVRVPAGWIVKLPAGLTPRAAMSYGTAGLTAAQCVEALQLRGVMPGAGEVIVTGASGGVGSIAVGLLAKLGYDVTAVSGKPAAAELLQRLGARRIVGRGDVDDKSGKPLLAARYIGAVDSVGGNTLATLLKSMQRGGVVAACGLVGGAELPLTVFPFILRGVDLAGIDSVECPPDQRRRIWSNLAGPWSLPQLEDLTTEITLDEVGTYVERILKGETTGRIVVRPTTTR